MAKQAELNEATTQTETVAADEFSALLKQSFKPRTERAATEVDNAISTLVREALKDSSVVKSDVLDTIEEMIARLDQKLTAQMNEILFIKTSSLGDVVHQMPAVTDARRHWPDARLVWVVEQAFAPLARRLGWRPEFPWGRLTAWHDRTASGPA